MKKYMHKYKRKNNSVTDSIIIFFAIFLSAGHISPSWADKKYSIEEVGITARASDKRILHPTQTLNLTDLALKTPTSLSDIFQGYPGVAIRLNSRGDTSLRIRGGSERQTQVFLDGAPLTIPWDGRVDLRSLPIGMIERIQIIKSTAPIEYGANTVLGVIDLQSKLFSNHMSLNYRMEFGSHNSQYFESSLATPLAGNSLVLAASYRTRDAQTVADYNVIPYDPSRNGTRSNTDEKSKSFFGAFGTELNKLIIRLSLLHVNTNQGIAAEGHLDPKIEKIRFWRYPVRSLTQVTLNSELSLASDISVQLISWRQWFRQVINSYKSSNYSNLKDQEKDNDHSWGARILTTIPMDRLSLRIIGHFQNSTHDQINSIFLEDLPPTFTTFQQKIYTIGAEIDIPLSDTQTLSFGGSYDRSETPKTGLHPQQHPFQDWAANFAYKWQMNDHVTITATTGKRTRFPSLRELYGESLGRFLVNTNLRPETVWQSDITALWKSTDLPLSISITPFLARFDHILSRRTIKQNEQKFRQRYNMKGSTAFGIETHTKWSPTEEIDVTLNSFWQNIKTNKISEEIQPDIYQRPNFQASLTIDFRPYDWLNLRGEVFHTGSALDENSQSKTVRLNSSTEINLKAFIQILDSPSYGVWQLYGTIDNLSNTTVLPQLGLPLAGRYFRIGLKAS